MLIGMLMSVLAMLVAGCVEKNRLDVFWHNGTNHTHWQLIGMIIAVTGCISVNRNFSRKGRANASVQQGSGLDPPAWSMIETLLRGAKPPEAESFVVVPLQEAPKAILTLQISLTDFLTRAAI